jgi:hypothetical protein
MRIVSTFEILDDFKPAQNPVMCLVGEIFEAFIAGAFSVTSRHAIAPGDYAAGFVNDFAPSLTRFFDEWACFSLTDTGEERTLTNNVYENTCEY